MEKKLPQKNEDTKEMIERYKRELRVLKILTDDGVNLKDAKEWIIEVREEYE